MHEKRDAGDPATAPFVVRRGGSRLPDAMVDIKAVKPFKRPVTLDEIKKQPGLEKMILVNNSRLSVQPVTDEEWAIVCRMGGL